MTEISWDALRADAIVKFGGQTPRPQDEANIIQHFERQPIAVLHAIEQMAATGPEIRWKWSALAARLDRTTTATRNVTVDTGPDREQLIARADQWLRNAGFAFPAWHEVEDELFGERGPLKHIADDKLRARYQQAWQSLQPVEEAA